MTIRVWQYEAKVERVQIDPERITAILTHAISTVTCAEDRQVLRDALISVPLSSKSASEMEISRAKKALILWGPGIVGSSSEQIAELPDTSGMKISYKSL